ncbi:hypothetical protein [Dyella psychrodurans]|uniref:Uncharacterized protein n=1 Tax=Dyella psychrodurans TaxID=1927960 RepID=A0A370X4R2_9GAMM|nr:hypothetical protein [Dyella psychrodurans]RDS83414.1 hypothetical protein DWU99_12865 [Dyella psychrodurans]
MSNEITSETSRKRSKQGIGVLVIGALAIAAFRFLFPPGVQSKDTHGQINLPIPTTPTPLNQVAPVKLSAAEAQKSFQSVTSCNIEAINGQNYDRDISLPHDTTVGLGGWLINQTDGTNAKNSWIELIDTSTHDAYKVPLTFRAERQDVQEAFEGREGFADAGFLSLIGTSNLPGGRYHVLVAYDDDRGQEFMCDAGRILNLN